jgi:hypothetical protein
MVFQMLLKSIDEKIRAGGLKLLVKYRAIIFLVLTFTALNFHVLTENATTMPPHSIAFGITGQVEPALQSHSSGTSQRALAGYYTADPTGTSALYSYDHFVLDSLMHREIPFWNPYTLTGLPFLAEYQWGIFYPFNLLRLIIPEGWWDLYSALHILLLAFIVYLIARSIYGNYRNSIFAGMAVFGIGFLLLYFPTHTVIVVAPWGAMLFLGAERLIKKEWDFAGLAFIAAGVYGLGTAGHPTPAIFWTIAFIVFLLARFVFDRSTTKALFPLSAISILAAFAAAPNVIPFVNYMLTDGTIGGYKELYLPNFYSVHDLFLFLFPYVFGPLNSVVQPTTLTLKTSTNTPGFLLLPPFMFLPAFVGGWIAIKRRKASLLALMTCALFLTLWAFGVPPVSWLSNLPFLARLTFHYSMLMPSMVLCVLAGYGYGFILRGPLTQLRRLIFSFIALYLLATIALIGYLWSSGVALEFFRSRPLLLQGFLPSLAFAVVGPLLILLILYGMERNRNFQARVGSLSSVLMFGFGFSVAAVYPTANVLGETRLPLIAFTAFLVISICFALLLNSTMQKDVCTPWVTRPLFITIMASFIAIANLTYPGLPKRYDIVGIPSFIRILSSNRLNWRDYGMNGAIPLNNLVRFRISAFNNQNAIVPAPLRNFISNYLDSSQTPNVFFGYSNAPDINPPAAYLRNIRFWEYIGVRYIIVPAAEFPKGTPDFWRELGFESTVGEPELVVLPQLSKNDSRLGLVQQVDCSEGAFSVVRVKLGTFLRVNPGRIVLTVTNSNNIVIAQASLDASKIMNSQFHFFSFGHELCTNPSHKINISIRHEDGIPGWEVAAWRSDNRTVDILRVFSQPTSLDDPLRLAFVDAETGIAVFEDPQALPRAYFTDQFSVASDWRAAQGLFAQQDNLRAVAYGEDGKPICKSAPDSKTGGNNSEAVVKVTELHSSSISLTAKVPSAGTVVLVDTFMPGWTAVVNGKPRSVLRINGLFRGICLDGAGTYSITMQYRPPYWNFAVLLGEMGFVGVVVILIRLWMKSRKMAK